MTVKRTPDTITAPTLRSRRLVAIATALVVFTAACGGKRRTAGRINTSHHDRVDLRIDRHDTSGDRPRSVHDRHRGQHDTTHEHHPRIGGVRSAGPRDARGEPRTGLLHSGP